MCNPPPPSVPRSELRQFDARKSLRCCDLGDLPASRKLQALAGVLPEEIAKAWRLFRLLYLTIKWIVTSARSGSAPNLSNKDSESAAACRVYTGHSGRPCVWNWANGAPVVFASPPNL